MNQKTNETKHLLAESLKRRMTHYPFDRITIKDITDEAVFIRAPFYYHFKDKYDLVEWIFREEIIAPGEYYFQKGEYREGIRLMLSNIERDKAFYLKAVKIEGQNSFEQMVFRAFFALIGEILRENPPQMEGAPHLFQPEILAEYYATAETFLLMKWLRDGMSFRAEEVEKAHWFLISVSLEDIRKEISASEKE